MVWHFIKDPKNGSTRLVQQDDSPIPVVPVGQPATTTLPGVNFVKKFECTIPGCGKRFATQGVFSIHYNRHHRQNAESKEEWRQYVKELDGPDPA